MHILTTGLSDTLFYGARNISEAKLGDIIYIPAVSVVKEVTKLSGPSPLRNLLQFVISEISSSTEAYEDLKTSFERLNKLLKGEIVEGEDSSKSTQLKRLIDSINEELEQWQAEFSLSVRPMEPNDIIKTLVEPIVKDKILDEEMKIESFGSGFQRQLIYAIIKLSSSYIGKQREKKRENVFSPKFVMILFEEPEAYLHPFQQEILNRNLLGIARTPGNQVLISTHSPFFMSRHTEELSALIRLKKEKGMTVAYQITDSELEEILKENLEFEAKLGGGATFEEGKVTLRYHLWLDSDRCNAFFSDVVLICEGPSEKILIDYLIKTGKIKVDNDVYILNAMGKYNIPRYMFLFEKLGIKHSVLFDRDDDKPRHEKINRIIDEYTTEFTLGKHSFRKDLESFLGIPEPEYGSEKAINVIYHYINGNIDDEKLDEFISIVENLIKGKNWKFQMIA